MATSVDAVISRFRSAKANASGECPEKIDVVALLEPLFANPQVAQFLLSLLRDTAEYDLARVEVCRVFLGFGSPDLPWPQECAGALLAALADPDSDTVRQWAARALVQVADVAGVEDALVGRIVDSEEDLDVRHDALGALRFRRPSEPARTTLEDSAQDPDLDRHIADYLRTTGATTSK